ncbi:hypothetical protein ACFC1B_07235 [Streptomyces xiamenensis]|uniref:hypothetical protein n=1 Tax=Streptomyces xiamenensis TaxID=408015 RepID=UPI0035D621F4
MEQSQAFKNLLSRYREAIETEEEHRLLLARLLRDPGTPVTHDALALLRVQAIAAPWRSVDQILMRNGYDLVAAVLSAREQAHKHLKRGLPERTTDGLLNEYAHMELDGLQQFLIHTQDIDSASPKLPKR